MSWNGSIPAKKQPKSPNSIRNKRKQKSVKAIRAKLVKEAKRAKETSFRTGYDSDQPEFSDRPRRPKRDAFLDE